jgi:hypothetical protein
MRSISALATLLLIFAAGCGAKKKGAKTTKATKKTAAKEKPAEKPRGGPRIEAGIPVYFMPGGKANIVYSADDSMGSGLSSVEIWMSSDGGKKWAKYAEDKELTGKVLYEAKDEGTYDFTSVGIDKIGNREKELDELTKADFRVVVDRTPPKVTATAPAHGTLAPAGASFHYSWSAEDPYLAADPVELQIRFKKNPTWISVVRGLPAKGKQKFTLPSAQDDVAEVRFVARDRSGNVGSKIAGTVGFDRMPPVGRILGPRSASDLIVKVQYTVSDPGAASLKRVSLWISPNSGRSWRKITDAPPKSGEVEIQLPKAGSYGLALSAEDAVGNELKPPTRGTKPPFVVSTDTVPPKLEALGWVRRGQVVSARRGVKLQWKATDVNLSKRPVSVEFSFDGGRSWSSVGSNCEPTGSMSWKPSDKINSRRCLLRLVARDLLGNESRVTSPNFVVDNTPPKTRATLERLDEGGAKKETPPAKKETKKRGRRRRR